MKWKIFYEDGSTYSDEDGSFRDAPSFGVMSVVCDRDEQWLGGDYAGLIDYLCRVGIVKFGRMTDNQTYERVLGEARRDMGMGLDRIVNEQNDFYWYMGDVK